MDGLTVGNYYKLVATYKDKDYVLAERSKLLNNFRDTIYSFSNGYYDKMADEDMIASFKSSPEGFHIDKAADDFTQYLY
jgi:hypothetical protein